VSVEPEQTDSAMPCSERFDGADVRAAATAKDDGALRQVQRDGEVLLFERVLDDHRGFREIELQRRGLDHSLTTVPPRARNTHEAGGERSPARVALVVAVERNRRVGQAVGTLGAQPRHQSAFS
jgi:hypothetical protein